MTLTPEAAMADCTCHFRAEGACDCGERGCVTAWGPWCFACNVKRMDRIGGAMERAVVAKAKAKRATTKGTKNHK